MTSPYCYRNNLDYLPLFAQIYKEINLNKSISRKTKSNGGSPSKLRLKIKKMLSCFLRGTVVPDEQVDNFTKQFAAVNILPVSKQISVKIVETDNSLPKLSAFISQLQAKQRQPTFNDINASIAQFTTHYRKSEEIMKGLNAILNNTQLTYTHNQRIPKEINIYEVLTTIKANYEKKIELYTELKQRTGFTEEQTYIIDNSITVHTEALKKIIHQIKLYELFMTKESLSIVSNIVGSIAKQSGAVGENKAYQLGQIFDKQYNEHQKISVI